MKKGVLIPLGIVFVMRYAKQDDHGPRSRHSRFLKTQNILNASDLMFAKERNSRADHMIPTKPPEPTIWYPQNPMFQRVFMLFYIISPSKTLNTSSVCLLIHTHRPLRHPTFTFILKGQCSQLLSLCYKWVF